MTCPRHLVERALRREPVARTPCFPLVDVVYASAVAGLPMAQLQLDPAVHAGALARCVVELPIDGIYVNLCLGREQAARATLLEGRYCVILDDCLDVEFAENDVAAIKRTAIASLDDLRIDRAELFHPGMLETFQAMPEAVRGNVAVCVGLTGTFSQLGFLYGLERLMVAMIDQPEEVGRALERRHAVALRQAEEICRAGARFVWVGEGMASGSLIGPAMYRRFVLPYEQDLFAAIRRHGALSLLHICGNTTPLLSEIVAAGADGCDVDSPTDWPAAVQILGPKMCLKGNLSPMLFLPENRSRLAEACRETRLVAVAAEGFILSTGCLVPRDSCRDAFVTVAEACSSDGVSAPTEGGAGHRPNVNREPERNDR